ncbi:MAG: HAMP domain-containing sensor histidine kinase [Caldilineaceae bacterium]
MNPIVVEQLMWRRRVGYALTDAHGVIDEIGGNLFLLCGAVIDDAECAIGQRLSSLIPELNGAEALVDELLEGTQTELTYPWVNRVSTAHDSAQDMIYVTLSLRPRLDEQGQRNGIVCIAEDTTMQGRMRQALTQRHNDLQLLQAELQMQNQVLNASNLELKVLGEMKTAFCEIAAHKLRNPLTSIYGYLELLLDGELGDLDQEQRQSLQIVYDNAVTMLDAINNLVDAVRIDADRLELLLRPTLPIEVISVAVEQHRAQFEEKQQYLAVHLTPDLPPIFCDAHRVTQAIGHLLHNACKYTPPQGQITISAQVDDTGEFVEIAIADSGVGFEDQPSSGLLHRSYQTPKPPQRHRRNGAGPLHCPILGGTSRRRSVVRKRRRRRDNVLSHVSDCGWGG